jgi:hypothetical protein
MLRVWACSELRASTRCIHRPQCNSAVILMYVESCIHVCACCTSVTLSCGSPTVRVSCQQDIHTPSTPHQLTTVKTMPRRLVLSYNHKPTGSNMPKSRSPMVTHGQVASCRAMCTCTALWECHPTFDAHAGKHNHEPTPHPVSSWQSKQCQEPQMAHTLSD